MLEMTFGRLDSISIPQCVVSGRQVIHIKILFPSSSNPNSFACTVGKGNWLSFQNVSGMLVPPLLAPPWRIKWCSNRCHVAPSAANCYWFSNEIIFHHSLSPWRNLLQRRRLRTEELIRHLCHRPCQHHHHHHDPSQATFLHCHCAHEAKQQQQKNSTYVSVWCPFLLSSNKSPGGAAFHPSSLSGRCVWLQDWPNRRRVVGLPIYVVNTMSSVFRYDRRVYLSSWNRISLHL